MRAQVAYVISNDPLVIIGSFGTYRAVSQLKRPLTFIYHNPGWIRFRSLPRYYSLLKTLGKNVRIHFVTNEPSERIWLALLGQQSTCLGHNLHLRDEFFVPGTEDKIYDAVYAAVMAPYKRIHLASAIEKLFVLTYSHNPPPWKISDFDSRLRHARNNSEFLSKEAVRKIYQQSRVGLALSKSEGAMFSCGEYLLCGLPVVTTKNRGGRNRYLDQNNSTLVEANPLSVLDAVNRYMIAPPSGSAIRRSVLQKISCDRSRYLSLLNRLEPSLSSHLTYEGIWGGCEGIEKHAVDLAKLQLVVS